MSDNEEQPRESAPASSQENRIFVRNLTFNLSSEALQEAFSKFGNITDCYIAKDRESGRSRGFGFVSFEEPEACDKAIAEMNGQELDGRALQVMKAHSKEERGRGGGFRGGRGGYRGGRNDRRGGGGYGGYHGGHGGRRDDHGHGGGHRRERSRSNERR